jgi:hypothetical protein
MEITLKSSSTQGRTFKDLHSANLFLRGMLGKFSDAYYIIKDGGFCHVGSIDLEPVSFHSRSKNCILNTHLKTYATNVLAAISRNSYPFNELSQWERSESSDHYTELLSII